VAGPNATFGGALRLAGVTFDRDELAAGQGGSLAMLWEQRQPMSIDYHVLVELRAADGGVVDDQEESLGGGSDGTSTWAPGRWLVQSSFVKAAAVPPGVYAVTVSLYDSKARARVPIDGQRDQRERLGIPLRAYVATIYDDRTPPHLTIDVQGGPDVAFDWATETILLQIAQEALHNVRRHSQASAVEVAIRATGEGAVLRVADNGIGFDPAAVPEGMGIATMRAAVAVIEGTLVVDSAPGRGTTIQARLYADGPPNRSGGPNAPRLRVVRGAPATQRPPSPH
jgi:hypothetical protein